MNNFKLNPKEFLGIEELSALENNTLRGGVEDVVVDKRKEKKEKNRR